MSKKGKSSELIATEAIAAIKTFKKVGEIRDFVKGDTRKTVVDAVEVMAEKIKSKKSLWPFGKKDEAKTEKKEEKKKETPSR